VTQSTTPPSDDQPKNKTAADKVPLSADLRNLCIVGLIFFGMAMFLRHEMAGNSSFQLEEIRARLLGANQAGGLWGSSAIFLLSSGLLIGLGMPRLWICGAAGAVYGVGLGAPLALGGSIIGATAVYLLGRFLLADMVRRRFAGRLAIWGQLLRRNGFWWVLYVRLFPFTNATINSLVCGCCRVPFGQYLAGTLIGSIPLTLIFTAFGSGGTSGNFYQVSIGFVLLGLALLCRRLIKRFFPAAPQTLNMPSTINGDD
jgi:uncharacterized membrane protein YdjX (TVP38/TMEM64 family)